MYLEAKIIGNYYTDEPSRGIYDCLINNDELFLEHDKNNIHDKFAIKVMSPDYTDDFARKNDCVNMNKLYHIGYVPKSQSKQIYELINKSTNKLKVFYQSKNVCITDEEVGVQAQLTVSAENINKKKINTSVFAPIDDNFIQSNSPSMYAPVN